MNTNGENGPHPDSLRKMLGQLKNMVHEARRSVSRRRNRVYAGGSPVRVPRQICDVCQTAFDFSSQTNPEPPKQSRCVVCRGKLGEGLTAFVNKSKTHYAWLAPFADLKAGQVYLISDDAMEIVMKRFKDQKANEQDTASET